VTCHLEKKCILLVYNTSYSHCHTLELQVRHAPSLKMDFLPSIAYGTE